MSLRKLLLKRSLMACLLGISGSVLAQQQSLGTVSTAAADRPRSSEFNNHSSDYVIGQNRADPDYQDTVFGELMYSEASAPTRLEMLRLLSKETPSYLVFLQAVSMGLGIDEVLQAAVRYQENKGRDFAVSAISILPVLPDSNDHVFGRYQIQDLEEERDNRQDESDRQKPIYIKSVIDRFFADREILVPSPDWYEGQSHFNASAAELLDLLAAQEKGMHWYFSESGIPKSDRPIFISLYQFDKSVIIDGKDRLENAIAEIGPNATVPVVFIFNRQQERAIGQLQNYPHTLRGLQAAYAEQELMLTPTPEWQNGEYHIKASMKEVYEVFNIPSKQDLDPKEWQQLLEESQEYIPSEQDYSPEQWTKLVEEAKTYDVQNTSFLVTIIDSGDQDHHEQKNDVNANKHLADYSLQLAMFDDPRPEAAFPFVSPEASNLSLAAVLRKGITINRPDLIAALKYLGVEEIPVAVYYVDDARTKAYRLGAKGLRSVLIGAGVPAGNLGGAGGFGPPPATPPVEPPVCASPPCIN